MTFNSLNSQFSRSTLPLIPIMLLVSCSGSSGTASEIAAGTSGPTQAASINSTIDESANQTGASGSGNSGGESSAHDLNNTFDYANQTVPTYIDKDNSAGNLISNAGAALGRVLFYDKMLSSNDTVSCSGCHKQALAFSDDAVVSDGVNGVTGRHSMRLVNGRFSEEERFFWDERADTLEEQTTQPIRDHGEMGFSGSNGAPDFAELLVKLANTDYYPTLFTQAFGNSVISEQRMADAIAQFIRSIQSFDTRYDQGRAQARNNNVNFVNFTDEENLGKRLFTERGEFNPTTGQRQTEGGLGCNGCHRAPEFDIDDNSQNNGVITVAGNILEVDTSVTRSPSLRDIFRGDGSENGPFMHDGSLSSFNDVLSHYNDITLDRRENPNLDNRLTIGMRNNAVGQKLLLTDAERRALTAFLKTLSGTDIYQDAKWSDPFQEDGSVVLSR